MKVRLTNLVISTSPTLAITCDAELDGPLLPTTPIPPPSVDPPTQGDPPDGSPEDWEAHPWKRPLPLPPHYNVDRSVGFSMLMTAMDRANLTPIGVQGHGAAIVAALLATYPALDVYLSSTDSPIWPGFGSLDVTVDSGKKGWSFRPDGYFPWQPVGQR